MSGAAVALPAFESELAERWAAGIAAPMRLEDGRRLRVVFPGVPGGSSGPDFRGAILDAGGDLLRGDVELHLLASGWQAHGHQRDDAYAGVVLHVVALNDVGSALTAHCSGRLIPIVVLPAAPEGFPQAFTPPCALRAAQGEDVTVALARMGLRRLRIKANRAAPLVAAHGAGQALYALLLETLGGPANREAFAALSRRLPLAALLEHVDGGPGTRALAVTAHLKGDAAALVLRRAGLRPMASPGKRLDAAGALIARLWAAGAAPVWPAALAEGAPLEAFTNAGIGRGLALECIVNAVLPVALAGGAWPAELVERTYLALPGPGTYGRLKPLERWLGAGGAKPFRAAARLQGGLLLHVDYCTQGKCGRCPLSEG